MKKANITDWSPKWWADQHSSVAGEGKTAEEQIHQWGKFGQPDGDVRRRGYGGIYESSERTSC